MDNEALRLRVKEQRQRDRTGEATLYIYSGRISVHLCLCRRCEAVHLLGLQRRARAPLIAALIASIIFPSRIGYIFACLLWSLAK
jgi:hypothetical protein